MLNRSFVKSAQILTPHKQFHFNAFVLWYNITEPGVPVVCSVMVIQLVCVAGTGYLCICLLYYYYHYYYYYFNIFLLVLFTPFAGHACSLNFSCCLKPAPAMHNTQKTSRI